MANTEEVIEILDTIVNGIKDGKSPCNDVLQVWLEEAIRHLKEYQLRKSYDESPDRMNGCSW